MCSRTLIVQDEKLLPLFIDHLPEFAIKKLKEELNESQETKFKAIEELRSLLQKNENTSGINFHEDFLVQFLRRNKYRIRDTFQNLQNFINLNKKENGIFELIPDHYLDSVSTQALLMLPKRCPDGSAIVIFQIAKWNPNELPLERFEQLGFMLFLQLLRNPMNQINGFKFIYDFQETLPYLKYCTPQNLYLLYNVTLNCLPARYKEVHMINESFVMKVVWNIVKPFLSQKIKDRMFFHSDVTKLLDYFPGSVLPIKYGGTLQDAGKEDWKKKANKEHQKFSIEGMPNFYSC